MKGISRNNSWSVLSAPILTLAFILASLLGRRIIYGRVPCRRQKGLRPFCISLAALIIFSGAAQGNAGSWTTMSSGITNMISGIWGSSGTSVFAVGNYPEIIWIERRDGKIWYFDGSSWTQVYAGGYALCGIWGSSGTDVFAAGGRDYDGDVNFNEGIILHYNGTSWDTMTSGHIPLKAIWGSSGNDVFAVGGIWAESAHVVNTGKILHYDGVSWAEMSVVAGVLYGVAGSTGNDVFAVGKSGVIVHYNGGSWSAMPSGATQDLYGIWASAGDDVFAVGKSGTILHYDGSSWSAMSSGTAKNLYAVWGSSGTDVFAVGGTYSNGVDIHDDYIILHYNGSSWSTMTSGSSSALAGVWGSSSSDVFAVGYQTILHYEDSPPTAGSSGGGGGCFIATAAYGSFLAEEVIILQEFRDKYLLTHSTGRGIVSLYYRFSPPLADYIANHESFRTGTRIALMPVIYSIKYPMAAGLLFVIMGGGVTIIRSRRGPKER
jgi:hypothetical protein